MHGQKNIILEINYRQLRFPLNTTYCIGFNCFDLEYEYVPVKPYGNIVYLL